MVSRKRQIAKYVLADWLSTSLAVFIFNVARYALLPVCTKFYTLSNYIFSTVVLAGQILFPLGMLAIYYMSGYYTNVFHRSRVVEFTTTLTTAAIGTLVIIFVALINDLTNDRAQDYRLFFLVFALLFILVYIPRFAITSSTMKKIVRRQITFPTAIVGLGARPEMLEEFSRIRMPMMGFAPCLYVAADNITATSAGQEIESIGLDRFVSEAAERGIARIIVLPHPDGWEATLGIINRLYHLDVPIFVPAAKLPSYLLNHRLVSFTADPLIDVSHTHMSPSTLCTKRAIDIAVSATMLCLLAIPIAGLACAVKLDSRGPALFAQQRVGRRRKLFTMYKLRTMGADAEADGMARLSVPGDPRITRLGRFMRKYRLDELPQFFNVLRGDMSLVGPRPERLTFVERIEEREPSHALLHRMRPGITSLAMVKYGYASTVDEMVERMRYDLIYLQNVSLLSDIKILLYTFTTVFSGKGI